MQLAPSILSFDLTDIRTILPQLDRPEVAVIHLDVMDGQFVPPITFGDSFVAALKPWTQKPLEAHLMTLTPEAHFQAFAKAGCERILFHSEVTPHAHRLAQQLRDMGVSPGIAINPGTPVEVLLPLLGLIDMALVMTVNPGWGGQKFLPETLDKVRRLKAERPDLLVEVDGGIDPTTIAQARAAGVDLFVTGSFLARSASYDQAVEELSRAWDSK